MKFYCADLSPSAENAATPSAVGLVAIFVCPKLLMNKFTSTSCTCIYQQQAAIPPDDDAVRGKMSFMQQDLLFGHPPAPTIAAASLGNTRSSWVLVYITTSGRFYNWIDDGG